MLEEFKKKNKQIEEDHLIVGGACIIHHKIRFQKNNLLHLKTDRQINYHSSDTVHVVKNHKTSSNFLSSQKLRIKSFKNTRKDYLFQDNNHNFKKQVKVDDTIQEINLSNDKNNIKKNKKRLINVSIDSQLSEKKIVIINVQNKEKQKRIEKKILPQISQNIRSTLKKIQYSSQKRSCQRKSLNKIKPPNPYQPNNESNKTTIYKQTRQQSLIQPRLKPLQTNPIRLKSFSTGQVQISLDGYNSGRKIKKEVKNFKFQKIRQEFQIIINQTNNVNVVNQKGFFKFFIQKGNNGVLVKQLIKKRWWWHIYQSNNSQHYQNSNQTQHKKQINSPQHKQPQNNHKSQYKKINLYWTEWINKSFVQSLDIPNDAYKPLRTIYDQYIFSQPQLQQKVNSIRKISDQITFSKIKGKISMRNANYLKNHFSKPTQNNLFIPDKYKFNEKQIKKQINDQISQDMIKQSLKNLQQKQICYPQQTRIHNHIIGCVQLHSKKLMFLNLSRYLTNKSIDPFEYLPLTFYIDDINSSNYFQFKKKFQEFQSLKINGDGENIWILKPGENSNRGWGITVHKQYGEIQAELVKRLARNNQNQDNTAKRSVIVQKYLEKCFLIKNRKFDLRCYILITTVNGYLKGYWYKDGYIRTSSQEYDLKDTQNTMIHLTNQAVQCKNQSYGKFQDYNKLGYQAFVKYLKKHSIPSEKFEQTQKVMKLIAYYLIASVSSKIKRSQYTFELFGLDFMLDENLKPFLIQANSNPCLETKGPILTKIIRDLVQNVIMTAIDPLFPPPKNFIQKKMKIQQLNKDYFQANRFELIFSDKRS